MISQFHYKQFEPDLDTRLAAERVIENVEKAIPCSSTVLGRIEKIEDRYWATADVYSKCGMFTATAQATDPIAALNSVEHRLRESIDSWNHELALQLRSILPSIPLGEKKFSAEA